MTLDLNEELGHSVPGWERFPVSKSQSINKCAVCGVLLTSVGEGGHGIRKMTCLSMPGPRTACTGIACVFKHNNLKVISLYIIVMWLYSSKMTHQRNE